MARSSTDAYPDEHHRHRHSHRRSTRHSTRHGGEDPERARDEARPTEAAGGAPVIEELRRARAELYSQTSEERRRREDSIRASYISQSQTRRGEDKRSSSSRTKGGSVRRHRHHAEGERRRRIEEDESDLVYVYSPPKDATRKEKQRTTARAREEDRPRSLEHNGGRATTSTGSIRTREVHRRSTKSSVSDSSLKDRYASAPARRRTASESMDIYEDQGPQHTVDGLHKTVTAPRLRDDAPRLSRSSSVRNPPVSADVRPPLKRSSTTTRARPSATRSLSDAAKRLPSVRETDETVTIATSTRDKKRSSGLLAGLFSNSRPPPPERKVDCLTCGADDVPVSKSAKLGCGHRMCHDCLKRIFNMSVTDPQHMPPKCCTDDHIPLRHVERLFDNKFKILWNKKYQEYTTKNRIYCPTKGCGEWIRPSNIHMDTTVGRKYANCGRCKTKVCVLCNGKWHHKRECPKDEELNKLVEVAKKSGWQRCFNCKAMVELKEGCNHMTCRCTAEFCMICGLKWKTCDCPWFTYETVEADRLNHMNIPEPIRILYRRVAAPRRPAPETGYQEEMDRRREQERADEELARRLQLLGTEDDDEPRRYGGLFDMHNAAAHLMTDGFVQNATNILTSAIGQVRAVANQHLRYPSTFEGQGQHPRPIDPFQYQAQGHEESLQLNAANVRSRASRRMSARQPTAEDLETGQDTLHAQPGSCGTTGHPTPHAVDGLARIGRWLQEVANDPADLRRHVVAG